MENLQLQPLRENHGQGLWDLIRTNRDYLSRYLDWVPETRGLQDVEDHLRESLEATGRGEQAGFVITLDGIPAGRVDIFQIRSRPRIFEVGYWLAEAQAGKGVMTEAVRRILLWGFDHLGIHKFELTCVVENHGSRRVAEKLGFVREGLRQQCKDLGGRIHDMDLYGFLAARRAFLGGHPGGINPRTPDQS